MVGTVRLDLHLEDLLLRKRLAGCRPFAVLAQVHCPEQQLNLCAGFNLGRWALLSARSVVHSVLFYCTYMSSIVVLSGGLIRGGQVESFGPNMHHGPGRDQVGTVVVRSLEHRSRTREVRTPFDQSLRELSFVPVCPLSAIPQP
jgi:hypothetical protein